MGIGVVVGYIADHIEVEVADGVAAVADNCHQVWCRSFEIARLRPTAP